MMSSNLPLPFDPEFLASRAQKDRHNSRTGPRMAVGAPGFMSVRRAAEALGLQPRSVIYLLSEGLLSSQRLGRAHFVPTAEVERYRRIRRERAQRARQRRIRTRSITLVR